MTLIRLWIGIVVASLICLDESVNVFADDTSKKLEIKNASESTTGASGNSENPISNPATPKAKPDALNSKKNVDPLLERVEKAIEISSRRILTAGAHTPWQILHGILAYRHNFTITMDGTKLSALNWLTDDARFQGIPLFEVTEYGGRAHPYTQPNVFEGHPNQFLAILAISNLNRNYKFQAGDRTITISDLIKNAQMQVSSNEEITWTLWGLSHYLSPEARWTNYYGEPWSIERLVNIQTDESTSGAACGGTHGLFALTYARNRYLQGQKPLRSAWFEADQKIKQYIEYTNSLQNEDGSFSSSFFEGPQYTYDFTERLATSGHTLEWLMLALPQNSFNEEWVRRGVSAIATDLIEHQSEPIACGPLYHAVHGLILYRDHVRPSIQKSVEQNFANEDTIDKDS